MIKRLSFYIFISVIISFLLVGCVSKKDILYFQDAENYKVSEITYSENALQPNDILSVTISAAIPETALPYNKNTGSNSMGSSASIELLKLQGYLVNSEGYISVPVLGKVMASGLTTTELEERISNRLESGGHLVKPIVTVRLLNAKVTILGEVNLPGTYSFTEQNLTVPQALGYAGDLTISGKRDEIILIREVEGKRKITHLDLTTAGWLNEPEYNIKPNDILVVQPNNAKVKTAGYVGNVSTILTIVSVLLSVTILLTR